MMTNVNVSLTARTHPSGVPLPMWLPQASPSPPRPATPPQPGATPLPPPPPVSVCVPRTPSNHPSTDPISNIPITLKRNVAFRCDPSPRAQRSTIHTAHWSTLFNRFPPMYIFAWVWFRARTFSYGIRFQINIPYNAALFRIILFQFPPIFRCASVCQIIPTGCS